MNKNWYQRPVLVFFMFASISLVLAFSSKDMELGQSSGSSYHIFSVEFEYFGMDAKTMEDLIALKLEEAVMSLPGILDMEIQCQYGRLSGIFYFFPTENQKTVYLGLRDKVNSLYEALPEGVQKPRIYSSSGSWGNDSVMNIAVPAGEKGQGLRGYLENNLKPLFESVEGVAQVVVAGGGVDEILLQFNPDRMAAGNINPLALGQIIQEANGIPQGTWLQGRGKNTPLVFRTQIKELDHIRQLPIQTGKGVAQFQHFAQVVRRQRPPEEIVRLNGEECLSVLIKPSYDGNILEISRRCRQILDESHLSEDDYRILYDRGNDLAQIIRNIVIALVQSLLLILLLVPAFFPQGRITVLLLFFLPTTVLWTCGQLALLGFSLNRHTLSGITIALGIVADTAFVMAEFWNQRRWGNQGITGTKNVFFSQLPSLQMSMVVSSLTTIFVFIPLYFLDHIVGGIRDIAITMGLMVMNSLILGGFFLPVFLEIGGQGRFLLFPQLFYYPVERVFVKRCVSLCEITRRRRKTSLALLCGLSCLPLIFALTTEKNLTLADSPSFLTASVEYPTDTAPAVIDREVQDFVQQVQDLQGITFVTSRITTGVCRLEIGLKPDNDKAFLQKITQSIKEISSHLDFGYLHLNWQEYEGKKVHEIQVAVVGDEAKKCRGYARHCVEKSGGIKSFVQGVMNFKEEETLVLVKPLRQELARVGLNLDQVAQSLRWLIFGPVVDKWIQDTGEEDIRVIGLISEDEESLGANFALDDLKKTESAKEQPKLNLSQLTSLTIPIVESGKVGSSGGAGGLPLSTLTRIELQPGDGTLYRLNGSPCAYFTLQVMGGSTQDAKKQVEDFLQTMPLDRGYSYHFSRELEDLFHHYRILILALLLVVMGIILILCALREKPLEALLVSLLIPASLALPMIILALLGKNWESGDVVGMVLVSGLAVNNGIYLIQSTKEYMVINIQDKIASILMTSLSTIIGSIPLLLSESGTFATSLAFFMAWGTAGSLIVSLLLFPAVKNIQEV